MTPPPRSSWRSQLKEAGDNVMRRHGPAFQKLAENDVSDVSEAIDKIFVVYRLDGSADPIDRIVAAFADEIHAQGFVDRLNDEEDASPKGYKYGYDFLELPLKRDEATEDEVREVVNWV